MHTRFLLFAALLATGASALAQKNKKASPEGTGAPQSVKAGAALKLLPGFQAELLYTVPFETQGSWVNLALDGKGRILASDQYGGLYRFPAPSPGKPLDPATIQPVPAPIRGINGLLWVGDALYASVNDYEQKITNGLYRVTDSDGDDQLDKVELLRAIESRNDHGVHALLLAPDKSSIFYITGNGAKPTEVETWMGTKRFGEDHLLPRMPDGRGFMRDVMGPGGIIYRVSLDGKRFDAYSTGFRNIFDGGFHRDGELFTYDADMEYDFNTSWYRPTRINHVTSGSEWGWRNGAGKWPTFYPDNLPPAVEIGPGSPTGVVFGYGAKFPAKYQDAMFIQDWSRGKIHAVHFTPSGSSYTATKEDFLSGAPLAVADLLVHPADGALYFCVGGRKVQSALYRVTYQGSEATAPIEMKPNTTGAKERALRRELEAFHGKVDAAAIEKAWPHLASDDRFLRTAARIAIAHQPLTEWMDKALQEPNATARIEALLALAQATGVCPMHGGPTADKPTQERILAALEAADWRALNDVQRIGLVRVAQIAFNRFGQPDAATTQRWIAKLAPHFPEKTRELNWLLCETLVYLQSPAMAAKGTALLTSVPTQEEQIEYARSLRMLKVGWTKETRTAYFEWLLRAAGSFRGGASFAKFIENIRRDAEATITPEEKTALADLLARQPEVKQPLADLASFFASRGAAKNWTLDDLAPLAEQGMNGRNFANGRKVFTAVGCFSCHRFGNEGGMQGPDLSGAGGRYSPRDLLDSIINPSKEINEQFTPTVITLKDGRTLTGTVVNISGGGDVRINTDPNDPSQSESAPQAQIVSSELSKVSLMPPGLLNILKEDEILDLAAYTLSGGDPKHAFFK
jgi:putative heme-binding domain-containing protein